MRSQPVEIFDKKSSTLVQATLYDGLGLEQLLDAERLWAPARHEAQARLLREKVPLEKWPQNLHWDWLKKAPKLNLLAYECFGIHQGDQWQGLLMTSTVGHVVRLPSDRDKPLLYVEYLESAPWNVRGIALAPQFGLIGLRLFEVAVRQSIGEGFHGRVGLHALPQAECFYLRDCGMTLVGPDSAVEGMNYFELDRKQAEAFLKGGR